MKGIPSHVRSLETAQAILGSSSAKVDIADPEALLDPNDERELFVEAWCAHPDIIPDENIMAVPEPEEEHDGGSPLYLRPHEIIHDEVPMLRYLVRLRLVEFQDWHTPLMSSDEWMGAGDNSDSGGSNFNRYHPGFGGGGGASEPWLGPRSGSAFRAWESRRSIVVGNVICPLQAPRGTTPCRGHVNAKPATLTTCVEGLEAQEACEVDFARSPECSPSPVKSTAEDPMLDEALLCTREKGASPGACAAAAHSIDVCLRGERASYRHHQGFVGAALDSQLMLLSGHNAFVAAGPCDGPEFMFGDHDGEADMEPIFSGHNEASTSASLGQTLPSWAAPHPTATLLSWPKTLRACRMMNGRSRPPLLLPTW